MKCSACNGKVSSRLTDGQVQAQQHVVAQQRAGMFGLPADRSRVMSAPIHCLPVMRDATVGFWWATCSPVTFCHAHDLAKLQIDAK